jgi:hypothetical protein
MRADARWSASITLRDRRSSTSTRSTRSNCAMVLCAAARGKSGAAIERRDREIAFKQATIDKLTHEMAVLKRLKFAAKSEAFSAEQKSLLEETSTPTWRRWPPRSSSWRRSAKARARSSSRSASAAGAPAAPRDPPRAREHHLRLRLPR